MIACLLFVLLIALDVVGQRAFPSTVTSLSSEDGWRCALSDNSAFSMQVVRSIDGDALDELSIGITNDESYLLRADSSLIAVKHLHNSTSPFVVRVNAGAGNRQIVGKKSIRLFFYRCLSFQSSIVCFFVAQKKKENNFSSSRLL